MINIERHGHFKTYPGTLNKKCPIVLFFGRELNSWKMVASNNDKLNTRYFHEMKWAAGNKPKKNVELTWNPNQPTINQYVFSGENCPATAIEMGWTNFNGVAFKIAEMSLGTPKEQARNKFKEKIHRLRSSPVIFGDISPFGLPTDFLTGSTKEEYRKIQGKYVEPFSNELIQVLKSSQHHTPLLSRIGLVMFCGADTAEQQNRANIIKNKFRAEGSDAIIVTDFPFLYNWRPGGPKGFLDTLQTKHKNAYKKLQSIMYAWS